MVSASVCLVFSTAGDTDNCSDVRELSVFSFLTRSSAFSSLYLKRQINYLFQYQKNHLSDYLQYNCHNQSAKSNIHNLQNLFESFCYFKTHFTACIVQQKFKKLCLLILAQIRKLDCGKHRDFLVIRHIKQRLD